VLELLERPAAGRRDPTEFARFAHSWTARLRGSAYQLCRDWHLAQDLTQATLTRLYLSWGRAADSDNLSAYAHKVLLRVYLDHRRRRSNSETVTGTLREPVYTVSPELRLAMIDAVSRLPARDREIVLLRYFADHSVEQVADELGVPVTVVKSQTRRSLIKLRQMLRPDRAALFG
jgi:RNA polymerase sigma factor (sigma-70 family)